MSTNDNRTGTFARFTSLPLYVQILFAMVVGGVTGLLLGERAEIMEIPGRGNSAIARSAGTSINLVAVTHVLMTSEWRMVTRLAGLLLLNTTVAICIGLAVANTLKPGTWSEIDPAATVDRTRRRAIEPGGSISAERSQKHSRAAG